MREVAREAASPRRRSLKNDAIVWVVRVALAIASVLPRDDLVGAGRVLGWLAFHLLHSERARAERNLARAYPAAGADELGRLAETCFVELGALLADTVTLFDPRERASERLPMREEARAVLQRARDQRRGIILVTAHLGPWEHLAACLVESGFPLTTPVRPSYDPRLERAVHAPLRANRGVRALDRDAPSTPRALVRALREGGIVGFLIDLNTRVASAMVPFLGHAASTPTGPARLSLRTGAPVVAAFATRQGVRATLIRPALPPRHGEIDADVHALAARMNEAIGTAILAEPDRWIWMHDRWGEPRSALPEHSGPARG